jgi:hypothetical protein
MLDLGCCVVSDRPAPCPTDRRVNVSGDAAQ